MTDPIHVMIACALIGAGLGILAYPVLHGLPSW